MAAPTNNYSANNFYPSTWLTRIPVVGATAAKAVDRIVATAKSVGVAAAKAVDSCIMTPHQIKRANKRKAARLMNAIKSKVPENLSIFLKLNPTFNVHTLTDNSYVTDVQNNSRKPLFVVCLIEKHEGAGIKEEMAELLINHARNQPNGPTQVQAMINHVDDKTSTTPLMLAAKSTLFLFHLFLVNGGDPFFATPGENLFSRFPNYSVNSPIHFIAKYRKFNNLAYLVNHVLKWQAEVFANLETLLPIQNGVESQSRPLVQLVLGYTGASVKELVNLQPTLHAETPLFCACVNAGHIINELAVPQVRYLLEKGADPRALVNGVTWDSETSTLVLITRSVLEHYKEEFIFYQGRYELNGIGAIPIYIKWTKPWTKTRGTKGLSRVVDETIPRLDIIMLAKHKAQELDEQNRLTRLSVTATAAGGSAGGSADYADSATAEPQDVFTQAMTILQGTTRVKKSWIAGELRACLF